MTQLVAHWGQFVVCCIDKVHLIHHDLDSELGAGQADVILIIASPISCDSFQLVGPEEVGMVFGVVGAKFAYSTPAPPG